jgi:hypothetical protein
MPIDWRESPDKRGIVIEFTDPYSTRDYDRMMKEIFARTNVSPLRLLADVRRSTPPRSDFVQHASTFWRQNLDAMEGARIAVVVGTDAQFGMARMAEMYAEQLPFRIRVFRGWDDAEDWLAMA